MCKQYGSRENGCRCLFGVIASGDSAIRKSGLFVIALGGGVAERRIRVKSADAHLVQFCKKLLHHSRTESGMLPAAVQENPAQIGRISLGQKMHLPPANFLALQAGGKLPAISGGTIPPMKLNSGITRILFRQGAGIIHIFVLHHKSVFFQKLRNMAILFVELSVTAAGTHSKIMEERIDSLLTLEIFQNLLQHRLGLDPMLRFEG